MGADSYAKAVKAARWAGLDLTDTQIEQLGTLHTLLCTEATHSGAIGPNEMPRLWSRHIGDSLLFGVALVDASTCVDLGSGAGLPGIPLAIGYPEVQIEVVDRSGRRCDLMRRMIAVLRLGNCTVVHNDIVDVDKSYDAVVSRAAIPADKMVFHVKRVLKHGGVAAIAHSWVGSDEQKELTMPDGLTAQYITVPVDILDSPVRLLRIDAT